MKREPYSTTPARHAINVGSLQTLLGTVGAIACVMVAYANPPVNRSTPALTSTPLINAKVSPIPMPRVSIEYHTEQRPQQPQPTLIGNKPSAAHTIEPKPDSRSFATTYSDNHAIQEGIPIAVPTDAEVLAQSDSEFTHSGLAVQIPKAYRHTNSLASDQLSEFEQNEHPTDDTKLTSESLYSVQLSAALASNLLPDNHHRAQRDLLFSIGLNRDLSEGSLSTNLGFTKATKDDRKTNIGDLSISYSFAEKHLGSRYYTTPSLLIGLPTSERSRNDRLRFVLNLNLPLSIHNVPLVDQLRISTGLSKRKYKYRTSHGTVLTESIATLGLYGAKGWGKLQLSSNLTAIKNRSTRGTTRRDVNYAFLLALAWNQNKQLNYRLAYTSQVVYLPTQLGTFNGFDLFRRDRGSVLANINYVF